MKVACKNQSGILFMFAICHLAVGQNLRYLLLDGYHPIVVFLSFGCPLGQQAFDL